MVKFSNGEFFGGHITIYGEMVKRWNGEENK